MINDSLVTHAAQEHRRQSCDSYSCSNPIVAIPSEMFIATASNSFSPGGHTSLAVDFKGSSVISTP